MIRINANISQGSHHLQPLTEYKYLHQASCHFKLLPLIDYEIQQKGHLTNQQGSAIWFQLHILLGSGSTFNFDST